MSISLHASEDIGFPDTPSYLNKEKLAFFKAELMTRRKELIRKLDRCKDRIRSLKMNHADILDQSNLASNIEQEIDFSRRYHNLIDQVDRALGRIEEGTFGYCELTGEEIGIRRLEVQPWATLSIQALEKIEKEQASSPLGPGSHRFFN